ncbi:MAG TPA: HhH-GPD-type base excision DNA repair protein [Acidimicrobiales bacterium]|nr:HhH-GPD-type base excision DNA repair protein [Acidimicrobiales bacterium]
MPAASLPVTGDAEANQLLVDEPLALLIGMLLDQQVPMEWAFAGPLRLSKRLDGRLDAAHIAALDPAELEAAFKGPPAVHRFPGSMAKRVQALCQVLVDDYGGDAAAVWTGVATGDELLARIEALPGFGVEKSKIFTALLAKRFGVTPEGWEKATAPFSDDQPRSVADIGTAEQLDQVRAWKKMMRKQGRSKSDSPA